MTASTSGATYDAVVIGAGPAGSATAYGLARGGAKTCVIDKSAFPRDKLCGGGITERSKAAFEATFERTWDESLFLKSSTIEFRLGGRFLSKVAGHTDMFFTMRRAFDAYLLSLAAAAGAETKLDVRVEAIDLAANRLTLSSGETITYRALVGADGVSSQVAKTLFGSAFDARTIGFGLEVEVPRADLPLPDHAQIDFAAARWGYGWAFPKRGTWTIGAAGTHRRNPDLKAQLAAYLATMGLDIARYRVKGQYIPWGDLRKLPGRGNVLLCGDAAAAVDPITGEGIAYAMETGRAAAQSVLRAAQTGDTPMACYLPAFKAITADIRRAGPWRYLIFPAPVMKHFSDAFAQAGTLQRGFLDILAGRHGYDALPRLMRVQLWKGVKRRLRRAASRASWRTK